MNSYQDFLKKRESTRSRSISSAQDSRESQAAKRFKQQIIHKLRNNAQSYQFVQKDVKLVNKEQKYTYTALMREEEARSENVVVGLVRIPQSSDYAFVFTYSGISDYSDIKVHKTVACLYATEFLHQAQDYIDSLLNPRKTLRKKTR